MAAWAAARYSWTMSTTRFLAVVLALQSPATEPAANGSARPALQACLDAYVAAGRVPGVSAGLVLADGTALELCAGLRDRAGEQPLEPSDRMLAGSTGKTFVATVALQPVSEGKLELDEHAQALLGGEPWFARIPNGPQLTLRHLLSHRSGLERYEFKPEFARDLKADPERVWKPEDLLAYVLDDEPLFAPGADFTYSDTNYILVGLLIERVTGQALYAEIQERLLTPLELAGIVPSDSRAIPRLVQGHAGARDPLGLPDRVIDESGRFCINPQFEWAGGGFATTAGDLARWGHALYAGSVLEAKAREAMLAGLDAPELGRGTRYGLGAILWSTKRGPAWGHAGFFPGYMTELRFWPEHGIAMAVQVNTSEPQALPRPLGALCQELLAAALGG
jgi:D-alanyl-D-alanine carboxypeptidase